ncbi:FAT-domain-containing protein [Backusella circina FSU 941]|nr:FAT-domain-containing protein [Backusella circina FSU 941]
MPVLNSQENISKIFNSLKHEDKRKKAAEELREAVVTALRELPKENMVRLISDINRRLLDWTHGNDHMEKLGAITAIDHLIDLELEGKANRFYNLLWHLLPYDDPLVLMPAAMVLGHLAKRSSILTAELVDTQVEQALEWMQNEYSRLASVLILRELAVNAPTLIYAYISRILDLIWFALRDPKNVVIRNNAADCLSQCLQIVQQRETPMRRIWYLQIWEEAVRSLNMNYAEAKHGSLLALGELLLYAGSFMTDMYKKVCDVTLRLKDAKDSNIKKTVVSLLPTLAYYDPVLFSELYLQQCMNHLLHVFRKTDDKRDIYITVGKIALQVRGDIIPYLSVIISCIKEGLLLKDWQRKDIESSIFECINMLVTAVGQIFEAYFDELLDLMFDCNLSKSLIDALANIETSIKSSSHVIQERLLDSISIVLCGKPFKVYGTQRNSSKTEKKPNIATFENKDNEAVITALSALSTFEFSNHSLDEFIRNCVVLYLDDEVCDIREKAAVTTCTRFFRKRSTTFNLNTADTDSMKMVREVMGKLINTGITDPDPVIRKAVFSSIGTRFDYHMAQVGNINSLFMALNDEVFEIRKLSIMIIGRLTTMNPAYVLPSLRQTLIQFLTELEYSVIDRDKEEAAKLIGLLIKAAPSLSRPYTDSILKGLLAKVTGSPPNLVSAVLDALGELSQVCGQGILPYLDQVIPIIVDTLQDQSSSGKRYSALKTLGQITRSTGFVIEPYTKYPALLGTFIHILKTEQNSDIRRETIKVIGVLGALDPYKYKKNSAESIGEEMIDPNLASNDVILLMMGIKPSSPNEYYPQVVMHSLMKILKDPSLSTHHQAAMIAIMDIYKTLGLKVVQFLPLVIPQIISLIRSSTSGMVEIYFHKLGDLVSIVNIHIRNYLQNIFSLVDDYWKSAPSVQITIVSLVESVVLALKGEIKLYLPRLVPRMLHIFYSDLSERKILASKVLHAFAEFGSNMEEYIHLVIPVIVKSFENAWMRQQAINTMTLLCQKIGLHGYASRIIHPLVRVLPFTETRIAAMDLLCELIFQLNEDYVKFIPIVNKVIQKHGILHKNYGILVSKLMNKEKPPYLLETSPNDREDDSPHADLHNVRNPPVNQRLLKKAWETSQRSTKEDWIEWIRRLNIKLLEQSPSHALRACVFLATAYPPLARELFNAAFVSCWKELYENYGDELIESLKMALAAPNTPPEIIQIILQLAEFMEHDNKMLPIDITELTGYAQKCHAHAKALHYKEIEFRTDKSFEAVEMLMTINNQLQQPDAAMGILTFAQDSLRLEHKVSWYEKLHRYQDALAAYERSGSDSFETTLGRMRCLHALGEWDQLSMLAQEKWMFVSTECKMNIAPFAAAASWGLHQWDQMEEYIKLLKPNSPDITFFSAILAVQKNRYKDAENFIDQTRDLLDTEITALLGESYSRSYDSIVRIQMLSELEEIIIYKQSDNAKRNIMKQTWMKRLQGCEKSVEVWEKILRVRAMVISPQEDINVWIKYSNLCRKGGRFSLSEKSLRSLFVDNGQPPHPSIVYAQIKHIWASASMNHPDRVPIVRNRALSIMREFTTRKIQELSAYADDMLVAEPIDFTHADSDVQNSAHILSRCYLKQGEWQRALTGELTNENIPTILNSLLLATRFDRNWYKAWHTWALTNFDIIEYHEHRNSDTEIPEAVFFNHVVPSVQGFFRSVALSNQNSLQDILRLLRLWFKYGHQAPVTDAIRQGFETVNIDVWLQVIPQLIARIDAPNETIRLLIHQLLTDIGQEHPQALVYPLMVSSKSMNIPRKRATYYIIDRMRVHSAVLVEQALMVSQELVRVSILWYEMWYKAIEEASYFYFGDHNIESMMETLEPLHRLLERGPETRREVSFIEAYGRDLQRAYARYRRYRETQNENHLEKAWAIYYQVYSNIKNYLQQLSSLELEYISPLLLDAKNLDLAVPGYYHSGEPIIRIASFRTSLNIISSKQRPRQLTIVGSDGKDYMYLLKGHEDLRLDERVMQLLSLINALLKNDTETFKRRLHIERYSVVPLSPNSGLIGWLPDTDTLHALITEYRESKEIILNLETRLMFEMAPNYEQLGVIQKVEVFQAMLDRTGGLDLYQMLWLKSRNSEAWLDRRSNYIRSLAVMSMVGYILGLGDRHPSNLMLHRTTGKVIHIDFGDCFEVTMDRERFPEKIPFRLTRMLVKAMEVSGIEGNFRITCENVMRVLRGNKDSLMAVLEAFVYDPLISWRLLHHQAQGSTQDDNIRDIGNLIAENGTYNSNRGFSMSRRLSGHQAEAIAATENTRTPEILNTRAVSVMERVSNKLTGRDFDPNEVLDTSTQVNNLIQQAVSLENLCQCFVGWCPFW